MVFCYNIEKGGDLMKRLQKFLIVIISLLLGACAFRSFAIYNDFTRHPELYATYSAPWYTSIIVTVVISILLVLIILTIYFVIGYFIKKRKR